MKEQPIKVVRYGVEVWENPILEKIRHAECLCWNCSKMKPGKPDHCSIAASLYAICVATNVATPVSRCPEWNPGQPDARP